MKVKVEIRNIEPLRVAYMTHKGLVTEADTLFPAVFQSIRGVINAAPFFIYHQMDTETMEGVVDVCEATAEMPDDPEVAVKAVPGVTALVARHIGPYDTIYQAYGAVRKYADEKGIALSGPSREVFIKGPNLEDDPAKYITDVIIPMQKSE